jgi:biotin carboxylase
MKTKLIIIGASYLQVPLILKAREMGIETHVFAWEQGAVGREYCDRFYPISIVEKEVILAKAREIGPHGVATIASDLAAVTVNYVADGMGLMGNPLDVTARTTNKHLMRQALSAGGLPCPRFMFVKTPADAVHYDFTTPVIVKPTDRSGSRGVTKVLNSSDIPAAVERALGESLVKQALIEEFIEGREISVESITWNGVHHILAMTDKVTTGAPYFVETEQHQPSTLPASVKEQVGDIVQRALMCLGVWVGASHSELLITADRRPYIVEIGARMGGDCIGSHLVEMSTGYDFLRGVIEAALGRFQPVAQTRNQCAGIYYLTATPGIVKQIIDHTKDYPAIVAKDVFVKKGDTVHEIRESGERLGYFIYAGPSKFASKTPPLVVVTDPASAFPKKNIAL